jgi:hypothetical protein
VANIQCNQKAQVEPGHGSYGSGGMNDLDHANFEVYITIQTRQNVS